MKFKIFIIIIVISSCLIYAQTEAPPRIGLVLSGGGAKGLAHIGVLKVLEEYGIQPEFITGTSMGSIIGALYSLGYSAEELEDLLLNQNWDTLLFDIIPRNSISLEEKESDGRYALTFPIQGLGVSLPKGLVAGQNVSQLITRLTVSAHQTTDFRKLPIPFLCIATNIETGQPVVLDSGFLPEAIRASMSIPSMLTPVLYEDKLLVDGGLVRNFPVSDCRKMGANFIIGVDVGTGLQSRDDLNSLVSIMQQAISFQSAYSTEKEHRLCNILIMPDVEDYTITDFQKADSLITLGEKAARKVIDQLIELKKELPETTSTSAKITQKKISRIFIKQIKIEGLHNVSKNLVMGKLKIKENSWTDINEIDDAITQIYGSRYFERVIYKLQPLTQGNLLTIMVAEKSTSIFRFGIHYDSDMKAAMLLNTTFRNFIFQGSKITFDARLGENKGFRWSEFIHTGWKPGIGIGWDAYYDQFTLNLCDDQGEKIALFNVENTGTVMDIKTIFSNNFALGVSADIGNMKITSDFSPAIWGVNDEMSKWLRVSSFFLSDSRNKAAYPSDGSRIFMEVKSYFSDVDDTIFDKDFTRFTFDTETIIPMTNKVSMSMRGYAGFTDASEVPYEERFYLGGFTEKNNGIPLTGFHFGEIPAEEAYIAYFKLQYQPIHDNFIVLRYDAARIIQNFNGVPARNFNVQGWSATAGFLSPIGPIEFTLMGNDQNPDKLGTFISIGYNF
ncbi:MAG: patatin-like phospholipase family protein [Candidatus Stygibacter frigidus]|nr:patatin-like phospholipase family protein [Candidatus Stygibacter frigidus]